LQSAELVTPNGDFELAATGDQRQGQINRGGQLVNVVEQSYVLRPQSEGALQIPPFTLRGAVHDPNSRSRDPFAALSGGRDPFAQMERMMAQFGGGMFSNSMGSGMSSMFGPQGKPFIARSNALTLDIKANPDGDASGWFLPAKSVQLQSDWLTEKPVFREGEAVGRRISLSALGARPEQLPDLHFDDPVGARIYVDDIQTDTLNTAEGTAARRDFLISVVPTQGGEVVLPEITVNWLNTANGETQIATLASEKITVEGTAPAAAASIDSTPSTAASNSGSFATADNKIANRQLWLVGGLLGFLTTGFIAGGLLHRRRNSVEDAGVKQESAKSLTTPSSQPEANEIYSNLQRAAKSCDTNTFYSALLGLRNQPNLADPQSVERAITMIENTPYAPDASGLKVNLSKVPNDLKCYRLSTKGSRGTSSNLPPLYPVAASH